MKVCKTCTKELSEDNFEKRNNSIRQDCKKCRNQEEKIRRNLRVKNGCCYRCKNKQLENRIYCEKHWYEKVSSVHLGQRKRWKELKDLAIKQNYKCVYTNDELKPSINMSLDHIKPLSKFPKLKNNINNLQWVTKDVNTAKNDLSHDEFLNLIKTIHRNII